MKIIILSIKFIKRLLSKSIKISRFAYEKTFGYSFFNFPNSTIIKSNEYKNIFCGYYDISPFNPLDSNYLLIHGTNSPANKVSSVNDEVAILLYDIKANFFKKLSITNAWNWQQGSRLQWINQDKVIFNFIKNNNVLAKVIDLKLETEEVMPIPVSIVNNSNGFISIDYFALTKGSEYGYNGLEFTKQDTEIKYYDFNSRKVKVLFDWKELSHMLLYKGATKEHINHILFSPCGKKLIYIHRFWVNRKRYDSLVLYKFDENKLIPILSNQVVSHYCWKDSTTLFAWLIIDNVPGYYLIDILTSQYLLVNSFDDGHPSKLSDELFITDRNIGNSFLGNKLQAEIISTGKDFPHKLGIISHPTIFDYSYRCDMHISLSKDKKKYQLDAMFVHDKRMVVIGDIPTLNHF